MNGTFTEERRLFFRIDDEIYLKIETLTENEYQAACNQSSINTATSVASYRELVTINYEIQQQIFNLGMQQPVIAKLLSALNNKMDIIVQQCLNPPTTFEEDDITQVNISASGLSYYSNKNIPPNQPLKIILQLLPEGHYIEAYGRSRQPPLGNQTESIQINIDFEHIDPIDQELMIKHNINKQKQILREQK